MVFLYNKREFSATAIHSLTLWFWGVFEITFGQVLS